jgi:transcriptional regulator GlxA family with amidase domain
MTHRLAVLVFPDFQLLDAAGPLAAFEVASRYREGCYAMRVVAAQAGPVSSSSGASWVAQALPRASEVDTLLVAGGDGVDAAMADARTRRFVQRCAARRGVRVASVCSGSLLLAACGLLDGKRATTHWCRSEQFARQFPQVRLDPERIYVNDGPVWTSAGISAGIDLALAMIGDDVGERIARQVARQLVVYYRRPGGQSQFSALLDMDRSRGRFKPLLDHVRRHLRDRHRVDELAEQACMSPRHFARAFQAETGLTPAKAVEKLRVEAARAALESGAVSVQRVASDCGFGDAERMRRSFQRLLGVPPSTLRARRDSVLVGC